MVKVRVQLVPDFGARRGQVQCIVVVESSLSDLIKVVQNKLQLKKKDVVTLYCETCGELATRHLLQRGDLSKILENDMKIIVCMGEPKDQECCGDVEFQMTKRLQKVVDDFLSVPVVGRSAVAARGRPNPATLYALQKLKGVTGIVTLLRDDEGVGSASSGVGAATVIGQACQHIGLRWFHAPLTGPKRMGMIGDSKPNVTEEDLAGFRKAIEVKEWLESGTESLVVHCAAGLHRTGIFLYILLRLLGHDCAHCLHTIMKIRQATYDEFTSVKNNFQPKVEAILALLGDGSQGNATDELQVVEVVTERASIDAEELQEVEEIEEIEENESGEDSIQGE